MRRLASGRRTLIRSAEDGDSYAHGAVYSARRKIAPARRTIDRTSSSNPSGEPGCPCSGALINLFGVPVMVPVERLPSDSECGAIREYRP